MKFSKKMLFLCIFIETFFLVNEARGGFFTDLLLAVKTGEAEANSPTIYQKHESAIALPTKVELPVEKLEDNYASKENFNEVNQQVQGAKKGFRFYTYDNEPNESGFYIPADDDNTQTIIFIKMPQKEQVIPQIINNNNVNAVQNSSQEQTTKQNQTMKNVLRSEIILLAAQSSKNVQEFIKANKDKFLNFYKDHKLIVISSLFASVYLAILSRIKYLALRLSNEEKCWSFWKKDIALEHLFEIGDQKLATQLLEAIYDRYKQKDEKFLLSLNSFLNDTEEEIKLLKKYSWWFSTLKKLGLNSIFLLNGDLFNDIEKKLIKLEFLRSRLIAWENNKL